MDYVHEDLCLYMQLHVLICARVLSMRLLVCLPLLYKKRKFIDIILNYSFCDK